jgi:hypothetical protein
MSNVNAMVTTISWEPFPIFYRAPWHDRFFENQAHQRVLKTMAVTPRRPFTRIRRGC